MCCFLLDLSFRINEQFKQNSIEQKFYSDKSYKQTLMLAKRQRSNKIIHQCLVVWFISKYFEICMRWNTIEQHF